jgi:hypothetical protein
MDDDLQQTPESNLLPAIRVAPLGELRVYVISEEELNVLEQGSPASQNLNFALALLSSGFTSLATLLATDIQSVRTFVVFVVITVVFLVAGVVLFAGWYRLRRSSQGLAQRIRGRMPPPPGIPVS